jgi:hypothetical protein
MITKAPKYLARTGVGQLYNQRDNLGIVKAGKNLDKTAVGGAAQSDEVKRVAKQTGVAKMGQKVGETARTGLQNVKDDY